MRDKIKPKASSTPIRSNSPRLSPNLNIEPIKIANEKTKNPPVKYKQTKQKVRTPKFSNNRDLFRSAFARDNSNSFSCHDKALRKAGFDMAEFDPHEKEKREFIRRERERRASMRPKFEDFENQRPDPISFVAAAEAALVFAREKRKLSAMHAAKDGMYTDIIESNTVRVDPTKLIQYLYLVKEFPREYHVLQAVFDDSEKKPVKYLIERNKLFTRFRDKYRQPETVVQTAVYELGTRTTHPICARYEEIEREKERAMERGTLRSIRTKGLTNEQLKQMERELYGKGVVVNDDLTPLERARAEVELWMKDKTTAQIIKAKELALKVLAEDSNSIRLWWSTHKPCRYIRRFESVESLR